MIELITRSLSEKNVQPLVDFPKELLSPIEEKLVNYILDYNKKFSMVPTVSRVQKEFDTFIPVIPDVDEDPIMDLYEQTLSEKLAEKSLDLIETAKRKLSSTGEVPIDIMQKVITLHTLSSGVSRYTTFDRSLYFRRKMVDLPFRLINRLIGGLGSGDFFLIIGRLGTGKSTIGQWIARHFFTQGSKILYVSTEMLDLDIFSRLDAMFGEFNPIIFRSKEEEIDSDFKKILENVFLLLSKNEEYGEIIVPRTRLISPREIYSYAKNIQADLIIVDGVYLLSPSEKFAARWESVAKVSNELKQIAMDLQVPLLGITQIKRGASGEEGYDPEDIAYSDALGQDADEVLAVYPNKIIKNRAELQLIKNRFGSLGSCQIYFDFDKMKVIDETIEGEVSSDKTEPRIDLSDEEYDGWVFIDR